MSKARVRPNHFKDFLVISSVALAILVLLYTVIGSTDVAPVDQPRASEVFTSYAVLSDSSSDEYRADNNRGGSYGSVTVNWLEQLVKFRNLNFGTWSNWGGFRRTGYQYNFSLSGATTASALSSGSPRDLGALVQSGTVRFVFYNLGANDFAWYNSQFGQIYNGQMTGSALTNYINSVVSNITTSLDTINASGKAKILVATVPNAAISPGARANYPDPVKIQRVNDAVNRANDGVRAYVSAHGYTLFDNDVLATKLLGRIDASGNAMIGGQTFSFAAPGDEPHHIMLSDNIHAGTVFEGLYANEWMNALNTAFGTSLVPFTETEILMHAGLAATSTPIATTVPTAVPTSIPTIVPTATARPTVLPTALPTIVPTIRPTATPLVTAIPTPRPTMRPTATPLVTMAPTPRPTPIPVPVDPLVRYCGSYRVYRYFAIRFLSPSQIRVWDVRCGL